MRLSIALLALVAPAALAAGTPPADGGNASATDTGSSETIGQGSDKVTCKREKVSGSRVTAKKVCQTAAQWERQRREDQQLAERVQSANSKSN